MSIKTSVGLPSEAHTQPDQVKVTCNLIISPLLQVSPSTASTTILQIAQLQHYVFAVQPLNRPGLFCRQAHP